MVTTEKLGKHIKTLLREHVEDKIQSSSSFVITSFTNLSVNDLQKLRRSLDEYSSKYLVVKNTIIKRALKDKGLDELIPLIDEQTGIVLCDNDPVAPLKSIEDFNKNFENFTVKGGSIDGKICDAQTIATIASLPSREVLIAQVLSTMKSPITGFVFALKNMTSKLVVALDEIKKKKGEGQNG